MLRCHKHTGAPHTQWYHDAAALPAAWDAGLTADDFLSRDTLAVAEATAVPDVRMRYAMLEVGGVPLARAAFQILQVKPAHVREQSLPQWQYRLWTAFTRLVRPRLLVGGQLFRHDVVSVRWHESLSAFEAFTWYRDAIREAAKKSKAMAVLIKEPPPELVPHFLHGAPEYLLLRNDISMRMSVPPEWQNMSDYEQSLKHKYAQRFRKVRRSGEGLRVAAMSVDEVAAASATMLRLYLQVTDHQPVRMGFLSEQFIPTLKKAYAERLKVWGIWEGDEMVAFASGWVNEHSFDMFYIGFDYKRNAAFNLYFNILFFAIEQAIALRKPLLILGRTALEAKARVGCVPEYLNTFLFVRNKTARRIISGLQSRLGEAGNEWEQRHPFKAG